MRLSGQHDRKIQGPAVSAHVSGNWLIAHDQLRNTWYNVVTPKSSPRTVVQYLAHKKLKKYFQHFVLPVCNY